MNESTLNALKTSGKVARFIATERVITLLTRGIDALMLWILYQDPTVGGMVKTFLVVTPINIVASSIVVMFAEFSLTRGVDLTGLGELRQMADESFPQKKFKRCISWILRRRGTIFWVGSWFYLDPDYVTLLLLNQKRSLWINIWRITVPSAALAIAVWTPIYFGVIKGVWFCVWLWDLL